MINLAKIDGNFYRKDIISLSQFNLSDLYSLFAKVDDMRKIAQNAKPSDILAGKIVVLLFFEPSSRTMGSFDAAVKQLGGQTIAMANPQEFSSVVKGESFTDTIKVFEAYSDAIVIRHPEKGKAQEAAKIAGSIPVINAGDGIGEHPTQALLDLFTIWDKNKRLNKITGLIAGDIKNGRTVHSLLRGLSLFKNNLIYLLAPETLKLDGQEKARLQKTGIKLKEIERVEDIPKNCDFWYWTRVQKERFKSESEYQKVNNKFIVDKKLLNKYGNKNLILMHPLPRVGEIKEEVDSDSRAVYLTSEVRNGMYVRMALLDLVLNAK